MGAEREGNRVTATAYKRNASFLPIKKRGGKRRKKKKGRRRPSVSLVYWKREREREFHHECYGG